MIPFEYFSMVGRECISLISTGYVVRLRHITDSLFYVKMVHSKNGNEVIVKADSWNFTVLKNGIQLKGVKLPEWKEKVVDC